LNEDIKDVFPYDAVKEYMVTDKDGKFGEITIENFPKKDRDRLGNDTLERFNNKPFWPLVESYIEKEINILRRSLEKIEEEYNRLSYSITDKGYHGIASIAFNHGLRYIRGDEFKCFDRRLYDDGNVPLGIPCKIDREFNRIKGRVLYRGMTEELKNLVRLGAKLERIDKVLHYDRRREGSEIGRKRGNVMDDDLAGVFPKFLSYLGKH
jgi:hypothetical protein